MVEHALGNLLLAGKMLDRDILHRAVHALVVMGRGDDQVAIGHLVMFIDLVMVDEVATWSLDHPDAFLAPVPFGNQIRPLQIRVVQKLPDLLHAMQNLDHPRPVIGQRGIVRRTARHGLEVFKSGIGERRVDEGSRVHTCQWPDPIPADIRTKRRDEREFHVRPGAHVLDNQLVIFRVRHLIEDHVSGGTESPQVAVIEIKRTVALAHQ